MAEGLFFSIEVDDNGSIVVKNFGKSVDQLGDTSKKTQGHFNKLEAALGTLRGKLKSVQGFVFSLKGALAGLGIGITVKSFIDAADAAERYRIRLRFLLRSQEEGNKVFRAMNEYAKKVPFEFEHILEAATRLGGAIKGNTDEIIKWMPMIGDLAAAIGINIETTISQFIRMYSAGAQAADMFREHGILAMLGFETKVHYTAKETKKIMWEAWTKINSQFRGATLELGKTWTGLTSHIADRWFRVRNKIMDAGIFDMLKGGVDDLINKIDDLERTGQLDVWAKNMAGRVITSVEAITHVFEGLLTAVNEVKAAWAWIKAEALDIMIPGLKKERERLIKAAGPDKGLLSSALGLGLSSETETEIFLAQAKRIQAIDGIILKYKEYRAEARASVVEQLEAIGRINKRFEEARQWLDDLRTGWFKIRQDLEKHKMDYLASMGVGYIFPPSQGPNIGDELSKGWEDFSKDAADILTKALVDGTGDFLEQFRRLMASTFAQALIQPIISQAMGGLFSPGGLLQKSAFGISGGASYANILGAGAMGYGLGGVGGGIGAAGGFMAGSSLLTGGIFAEGGALAGLGGPIGALAGGVLGKAIQDAFDRESLKIPEIDTLWNVVGDQVELVSASWKDMSNTEGAKLIQSYRELLKDQTEFFARLSNVIGAPMAGTLQFGGKGQGITAGVLGATQTFQYILENYKNLGPLFGPDFMKEIQDIWKQTSKMAPFGTYKKGQIIPGFQDIISSESPYATFEESIYGTYKEWFPKKTGGALNEFTQNIIQQFISAGSEAWAGFYEQMEEKLIPFQEGFISTISGAFMEVPRSAGFQAFEDAFNQSLANSIKSSFSQMLGAQFVGPMTQALMPAFALSEQYIQSAISGQPTDIGLVSSAFIEGINSLSPIMQSMQPVWELFNTLLEQMNAALNLNTDAIGKNTAAILGPVDQYLSTLASMDTGPTSIAAITGRQSELWTKAFASPESFSAYAQFMTGGALGMLSGISPGYVPSEIQRVQNIPWVQQARYPEPEYMERFPGSGGSGIRYSPGIQENADAIKQALGPMFLDLKESQPMPTRITVVFGSKEFDAVLVDSLHNPDVAEEVRYVVSG